jgi:hypothetical protein
LLVARPFIFKSLVLVPVLGALAGTATPPARLKSVGLDVYVYPATTPTFGAVFPLRLTLSFLKASTMLPRLGGCMLSARPVVVLNGGETVLPCYPERLREAVPGSITAFALLLGQDAINLSGRACSIIRRYNRA